MNIVYVVIKHVTCSASAFMHGYGMSRVLKDDLALMDIDITFWTSCFVDLATEGSAQSVFARVCVYSHLGINEMHLTIRSTKHYVQM